MTLITLTLQSTAASPPYTNEAPLIDSVVVSPTVVAPGGEPPCTGGGGNGRGCGGRALQHRAHGGWLLLWTATCAGTFEGASRAQSHMLWTAPACVKGSPDPMVTVTVTNAFTLTSVRSFQVTGLPTCAPSGWTVAAPMGSPRGYHVATLLPNGKVLVSSGLYSDYSSRTTSAVEIYDPESNSWSSTGGIAAPRYAHTATL
ncbi:kelch repeat-containing protein [Stigmatella aurantiaca]|uniref:kelch repeat-containing protein n=1 Tax=Stigmatella aurantiaca TaxID=41 RepID=UPI0018DDCDCA|nr:kelch repeat-containing protein [Stigmatella aurantiaca]